MIGRSPRISAAEIATVRAQAGLVDTISRRGVKLTRRGREYTALCPFHAEKTPSFTVNEDKGFYHCFGCTAHGDVIAFVMGIAGYSFREAVKDLQGGLNPMSLEDVHRAVERQRHAEAERIRRDEQDARQRTDYALQIWQNAAPAPGTLVETYLRARGITILTPPSIRYLAAAKHKPTGLILPAMIAGVQGPLGGVAAVHRTYISRNGTAKASVSELKMALGPLGAGAVRLAAVEPGLGLAEGIETALSAMQIFEIPVWAALGSRMDRVTLPEQVVEVQVFADNGEAGKNAADKAAQEFTQQGRRVALRFPPPEFGDWNDALRALLKEKR